MHSAAPLLGRRAAEARAQCSYSDLKAKVCYEKTSFLLHMASFNCLSRVPHSVTIKIPTILYLGKVTTRVTIHIKNLVATKSWALPEPSLSHRPVCPGSFKKFGALSLRVAPWFPLRTWPMGSRNHRPFSGYDADGLDRLGGLWQ